MKKVEKNEAKPAKTCFSHIGGKLGVLLMENFIDKGWLAKNNPNDKHFYITELGEKQFKKMGVDVSQIKTEKL
jgi:hypothetical protein